MKCFFNDPPLLVYFSSWTFSNLIFPKGEKRMKMRFVSRLLSFPFVLNVVRGVFSPPWAQVVNEFLWLCFSHLFLIEFKQIHSIYIKLGEWNGETFQKGPVIAVKLKMTFLSFLSFFVVSSYNLNEKTKKNLLLRGKN